MFEGVRGVSYAGDIAIDDVSLADGLCTSPTPSPSAPTVTPFCDFEANNCGYTQDTGDVFDWTRGKGSTSSRDTGPPNDHTTGTGSGIMCIYMLSDFVM